MQKKDSDGNTTEDQIEQPKPGNPNGGLQVSAKTKYTVHYAASGTDQIMTTQASDGNGAFNMVSVETQKSDQVPAEQAPIAPSDKPK